MNHEMLLGPAIGFAFTVGTIAFVAATARGMELRFQTAIAADPDAFMSMGEVAKSIEAEKPPEAISDLAPPTGHVAPEAHPMTPTEASILEPENEAPGASGPHAHG